MPAGATTDKATSTWGRTEEDGDAVAATEAVPLALALAVCEGVADVEEDADAAKVAATVELLDGVAEAARETEGLT